jgi:glucose-6-phosphate-specific signal transduction histidine kinase
MNWLEDNAYLAPWLAPCITLLVAILQKKGRFAEIDWKKLTVYLAFLIALAVVVYPNFDNTARSVAAAICFISFGYILVDIGRSGR